VNDDETEEEIPVAETGIAVQREGQGRAGVVIGAREGPTQKNHPLGVTQFQWNSTTHNG
jgi:hypothetical protein